MSTLRLPRNTQEDGAERRNPPAAAVPSGAQLEHAGVVLESPSAPGAAGDSGRCGQGREEEGLFGDLKIFQLLLL